MATINNHTHKNSKGYVIHMRSKTICKAHFLTKFSRSRMRHLEYATCRTQGSLRIYMPQKKGEAPVKRCVKWGAGSTASHPVGFRVSEGFRGLFFCHPTD